MSTDIVTTTNLTRRFDDVTAVNNLNLMVPDGSIYGFLGPNGAGKTTTIRMLLGLIHPSEGEVCIFGKPLSAERKSVLARIGSLVESPAYYEHLTGRENLEVFRRLTDWPKSRIADVLKLVRLTDVQNRLVRTYSMGMKQRLGLAMALLGKPDLLILDEPTNGLDPAGITEIRELITRLPQEQGITVFLSSHLLSEVEQIATHIGIIQNGYLRFQGELSALHSETNEQVVVKVNRLNEAKQVLDQSGWKYVSNGAQKLSITAHSASDAAVINKQLVQAGIDVYHLLWERPSLEDIFLTLTNGENKS
ncbi:MAG: ABC transporter ATP-binding protein [Chloroflexota bacterium]